MPIIFFFIVAVIIVILWKFHASKEVSGVFRWINSIIVLPVVMVARFNCVGALHVLSQVPASTDNPWVKRAGEQRKLSRAIRAVRWEVSYINAFPYASRIATRLFPQKQA